MRRSTPHVGFPFSDTDVYKTLEAIAWAGHSATPGVLGDFFAETVALLEQVQEPNGMLNSYIQRSPATRASTATFAGIAGAVHGGTSDPSRGGRSPDDRQHRADRRRAPCCQPLVRDLRRHASRGVRRPSRCRDGARGAVPRIGRSALPRTGPSVRLVTGAPRCSAMTLVVSGISRIASRSGMNDKWSATPSAQPTSRRASST